MKIKNNFIIAGLVLLVLISLAVISGRYQGVVSITEISNNQLLQRLILQIRLPRIILSVIVGAGLAVAGLVMQTVFQNALADPGVLGINQASGFGAALGFLLFPSTNIPVRLISFVSGMAALLMIIVISRRIKAHRRLTLIFSGIAVSALFSAGLGVIKYLADPLDQLPSIVFWLLGSLSTTDWTAVGQIAPISVLAIAVLYLLKWRINVYSLNEEVLFSLGIKGSVEIYCILGISVLLTAMIISYTGLIGWVGLIIPNISKLVFGHDLRRSMPASIIIGAIFVLVSDTFARTLIAGEIPLGIITAFLGALIFILLMLRKGVNSNLAK